MYSDYSKVRVWQTHFSVHRAFTSLPAPELVVEEVQSHPSYRMDGRLRHEGGAQLVITLNGKGGIFIHGEYHPLTAGCAFLHNHDDDNICYCYPHDGKEEWRFIWIAFYGGNSEELVAEINRHYGYLFDVPLHSELVKVLQGYRNFAQEVQVLQPLDGAKLVYDLLEMLCHPAAESRRQSSRTTMIGEIQSLITSNPAAELQVEKIASSFQISREHLSRIFREETGLAIHEYIIRTRLKMAIHLLLQTRLSVKEISARCGWSDYSIFYRSFKKHFSCSPQLLRASGIRPQI